MERSKAGAVKPDEWQRDYFLGRDASGRQVAPVHMTKVKPPYVRFEGSAALAHAGDGKRARAVPRAGHEPLHSRTGKAKRPARPRPIVKPHASTRKLEHKAPAFRPIDRRMAALDRRELDARIVAGEHPQVDGRRGARAIGIRMPRSTWLCRAPI